MAIRFRDPDLFFFFFFFFLLLTASGGVSSDPQTKLLKKGCSQKDVTNRDDFFSNLNATFSDLGAAVVSLTHFSTAERTKGADPVYALFQCRDYLSVDDCLSCFAVAAAQIRNCSAADGAHVSYDGCFLRYESYWFFDQTALPGAVRLCGNETAPETGSFEAAARGLLEDLAAVTPRINGYFAAARRRNRVYAVAQCVKTVNQSACGDCLRLAAGNIQECLPATQGRAVDGGCFLRYSDEAFFGDNQTTDSAFHPQRGSTRKNALIGVFAGVGGFVLLVLLLFLVVNDKSKHFARTSLAMATSHYDRGVVALGGPATFRYKDLKSATNNFSEKNNLKGRGTADAYMGVLKNGISVAVYRIEITTERKGKKKAEFESEVNRFSKVCHRNLVPLLGCCWKGSKLLLVYEFTGKESLDKFLFGEFRGILNWKKRFDIIVGIARGLLYLHNEFPVRVIHRDIRSANIYLGDDLQPRIAESGFARIPEMGNQSSFHIFGSIGYMAPETMIHGLLSNKVDTYSFGIVVLEIISGRRCLNYMPEPADQSLVDWARGLHERDSLMGIVDGKLDKSEYEEDEMKNVIEVALLCTQYEAASRPTMSEVVVMLLSKKGTSSSRIPTRGSRPALFKAVERATEKEPVEVEMFPEAPPVAVPVKVRGSVFEQLGRLLRQTRKV